MTGTRYRRALMGALAAVAATAVALAPGVSNADEGEAKSPYCDYIALENVKIRTGTTVDSTALGMLPQGQRIDCDSKSEVGGTYADCGGGDLWNSVIYEGRRAWVAASCVKWDPA